MWKRKGAKSNSRYWKERKESSIGHRASSIEYKDLDVFKITEEPEELILDTEYWMLDAGKKGEESSVEHRVSSIENIVEKFELLKAEILKLGKSQIQTRMFAESEYRALREAIETLSADNDHVAEIVIEDLFSIADGLEAGIRAGEVTGDLRPESLKSEVSSLESMMGSWLDGMKIVHQRVMGLLEKFDVHPLHSVGKPFDPSLHVAVAVEHTQEVDDNIILEEQRRGYMRGDKVIRYAEVVVNRQPREPAMRVEENDG